MSKTLLPRDITIQGLKAKKCPNCEFKYIETRENQEMCLPCMRYLGIISLYEFKVEKIGNKKLRLKDGKVKVFKSRKSRDNYLKICQERN